jgi:uncharacterized Zn-binding protein involved in type VI secretion
VDHTTVSAGQLAFAAATVEKDATGAALAGFMGDMVELGAMVDCAIAAGAARLKVQAAARAGKMCRSLNDVIAILS